jgi:hypothetical protein
VCVVIEFEKTNHLLSKSFEPFHTLFSQRLHFLTVETFVEVLMSDTHEMYI